MIRNRIERSNGAESRADSAASGFGGVGRRQGRDDHIVQGRIEDEVQPTHRAAVRMTGTRCIIASRR
jgi:hypothetical protein